MQLDALSRYVGRGAFNLPGDEQHRPCIASHGRSLTSQQAITPEHWPGCRKCTAERRNSGYARAMLAVTTLDKKQRSTECTSKPASVIACAKSLAMESAKNGSF